MPPEKHDETALPRSGDSVRFQITSSSYLTRASIALQMGHYNETTSITIATIPSEAPKDHRSYYQMLEAIGNLPKLEELRIEGTIKTSSEGPLNLPMDGIGRLLGRTAKRLRKLEIQNVQFVPCQIWTRRNPYSRTTDGQTYLAEMDRLLSSIRQLTCLEEYNMGACHLATNFGNASYGSANHPYQGLLRSLARVPSLKKLILRPSTHETTYCDETDLQLLSSRICPWLQELVLDGLQIQRPAWSVLAPRIANHPNLKKLHVEDWYFSEPEDLIPLLQILSADSPLEDVEFLPVLHRRRLGASFDPDLNNATLAVNWRQLLANLIPQTLQTNTTLKRLCIKALGRGNVGIPKEVQLAWLDLVKNHNNTLQDLSFSREDGKCFVPADAELEDQLHFYLNVNKFGRDLHRATEEDRDTILMQCLTNAAEDVPCLFYFLQQYPAMIANNSRTSGR